MLQTISVNLTQADVNHIGMIADKAAKCGYDDGLLGAQQTLALIQKINQAGQMAAQREQDAQRAAQQAQESAPEVAPEPAPEPAPEAAQKAPQTIASKYKAKQVGAQTQ